MTTASAKNTRAANVRAEKRAIKDALEMCEHLYSMMAMFRVHGKDIRPAAVAAASNAKADQLHEWLVSKDSTLAGRLAAAEKYAKLG